MLSVYKTFELANEAATLKREESGAEADVGSEAGNDETDTEEGPRKKKRKLKRSDDQEDESEISDDAQNTAVTNRKSHSTHLNPADIDIKPPTPPPGNNLRVYLRITLLFCPC